MRTIPVDTSRISFIATGKIAEKPGYDRNSDGTSQATGKQAKDENGTLQWVVDCLVDDGTPDEENGRAEVVGVTVSSEKRPTVVKYQPVNFLVMTAFVMKDNRTGYPRISFKAASIADSKSVKSVA
jgi:hypothetical protein